MSAEGHNPSKDVYKESRPYMLKDEQKLTNSEKLKKINK